MVLVLFLANTLAVAEGPAAKLVGHTDRVTSVAFSPDGSLLASGSYDRTVLLWAVKTGSEKGRLAGHKGGIAAVTFSPNGRLVVSASLDGTVRLWDTETVREPSGRSPGIRAMSMSVAFSPDGRTLRQWELGWDGAAVGY